MALIYLAFILCNGNIEMTTRQLFDVDPDALSPPASPIASHPVYSDFSHIASTTGSYVFFFVVSQSVMTLLLDGQASDPPVSLLV